MRTALVIIVALLAGCDRATPVAVDQPALKVGIYGQQNGRGSLCVRRGDAPQRVAFVAYGAKGMANCSAEGTLQAVGKTLVLVPHGEGACRIGVDRRGDRLILSAAPAACAFYCAPGLALAGQEFEWTDTSTADMLPEPLFPTDEQC